MTGRLAVLASRYAGRPVLMLPRSAMEIAEQLHNIDARVFERPGRLQALFRGLRGAQAQRVMAMEDDDAAEDIPFGERAAYAPLYIGEPDDVGFCWTLKDGVALMQVNTPFLEEGEVFCGTVYHGYDTLLAGMREAALDERVKAIFIRMACPGGPVSGKLGELSAWMRANNQAAGGKPIHVYASMACSAAYWGSAPADKIWAPDVGLVASIGCVLVHYDYSGAAAKEGVAITPIQFGAKKTDGAWWEALSPTARADLQAEIDQCGRNFVADVALSRPKLTSEALLATEAAVFLAQHDDPARSGLALGFVDEIAGEEAAFSALAADVSDPQSLGMPSIAAPGGRAATKPAKEQPMALRPNKNPAASAAVTRAEAALADAQANLTRARAETGDGDGEGDGDDTTDGDAGNDTIEAGAGADVVEGQSEASAISASPEAKSHPQMALAAIQSGMNMAQFKAAVGAASAETPNTALDRHMTRVGATRRLGPDAQTQPSGGKIDAKAIYANRNARGRK